MTDSNWSSRVGDAHNEATPEKLRILVTGYGSNPYEPLLLEALANHPDVEKIYFVSFNDRSPDDTTNWGKLVKEANDHPVYYDKKSRTYIPKEGVTGHATTLDAYDITDLLKRDDGKASDGAALERKLKDHFSSTKPTQLSTDEPNICLSGDNEPYLNNVLARRHPDLHFINVPAETNILEDKNYLSLMSNVLSTFTQKLRPDLYVDEPIVATSGIIHEREGIEEFMDEAGLDEIALKQVRSHDNSYHLSGGRGVYRVFREKPGAPVLCEIQGNTAYPSFNEGQSGPRIFPISAFDFPKDQMMQAVKWMDPHKGDIRVIVADGEVIGAYMRLPPEDSFLANYSQRGSIVPCDIDKDLSPENAKRIRSFAWGMSNVMGRGISAIDFLEDSDGKRYLSEVNMGNTDDLIEVHKHGDEQAASRMASGIIERYHHLQAEEKAAQRGA